MLQTLSLLLVFLAGLLAQSRPVALAAGTLLLFQLTGFTGLTSLAGRWGAPVAWALLAAAALSPLALQPDLGPLARLASPGAFAVFVVGLAATLLAQRGLLVLKVNPEYVLALSLGFLAAALWHAPPWPVFSGHLSKAIPAAVSESRVVGGMSLLRAISGLIEVGAAFLMLRSGQVGHALQLNATLGLIGPAVNLLVCALGLAFVAMRFSLWRTGLVALGVVFIWFGTR